MRESFSSTPNVKQLIERINDYTKGNIVDVIVQIRDTSNKTSGLKNAAMQSLDRRRLAQSARDITQVKTTLKRKKIRKSKSVTSALRKKAVAGLSKLLKKPMLQGSLTRLVAEFEKRKTKSSKAKFKPNTFWSSNSVLLKLTKSELQDLPDEIDNIKDVRINRKLNVPIVKVNKPSAIELQDRLSTSWGLEANNAFGAWGVYGAEGAGTTIAVLDTGIDPDHPDLVGKIAHWAEFDAFGNIVDTENPRDSDQHGTHVAGTIAGGNSSGRWIGMAPQASIAAGLVLDGAIGGTDAQVLAGMDWAVEKGVDAINMSLGGLVLNAETPPTYSEAIVSAIMAGIPVVCAIGNEGNQTSGLPGSDLFALSVGATDTTDRIAGFSAGRTQIIFESDFLSSDALPLPYIKPDISAPGVSVMSCIPGGGFASFSGTSMATPHVAGAIALLLSATDIRSFLDNQDLAFALQELLTSSVDELGESGQDSRYGFGRLDVLRAIDFAVRDGFGFDV